MIKSALLVFNCLWGFSLDLRYNNNNSLFFYNAYTHIIEYILIQHYRLNKFNVVKLISNTVTFEV